MLKFPCNHFADLGNIMTYNQRYHSKNQKILSCIYNMRNVCIYNMRNT